MALLSHTAPQRLFGLLAALFCLMAPRVSAQTVRGIVTDSTTAQPVAVATVTLISENGERVASALTTDEGFFSLEAGGDGLFLVRATVLGYMPTRMGPVELESDALRVIEVRMRSAPVGIEGLVVEGARQREEGNYLTRKGFWERYERGRGDFLTPGEVLASNAMFTPHLLRGMDHVVTQAGAAPWDVWPMLGVTESRGCEPRIWVDDVWVNRAGFGIRETIGLDDLVPVDRITAVEVYYGPFQAPLRYQGTTSTEGGNACGVVLIWTR